MRRRQSSKLKYGSMEDRRMLAVADVSSIVRLDTFEVDESISITQDGSEVSYQLASGDTWTSAADSEPSQAVTGLGTDTLTIGQIAHPVTWLNGVNAANTRNVDIVFASDINDAPGDLFSFNNVTQLPGTAVSLRSDSSISAENIRLLEASNRVNGGSLRGGFVEVRSAAPINLDFIDVDDGVIASDLEVLFKRAPNNGGGSFFGPGALGVRGQLTVESGRSINIESSAIGVGRLNLKATDDIRIASRNSYIPDLDGGSSHLSRLNFQAGGDVNISLSEDWREFSGPSTANNLALVGDNFAQSFSLDWDRARLINAHGVTLNVTGDADLSLNSSYLAAHPTDEIHIDGDVFFKAVPFVFTEGGGTVLSERVISIAEPGDVRFGSLHIEDATYATVHEDDSTLLLGAAGNPDDIYVARQITFRSAEDIVVHRTALIQTQGVLTLEAEGDLVAQRGQDKTLKGQQLVLKASTINLDQVDGDTVNFNSAGDVTLLAPRNFALRGSNTGKVVRVTANERIASSPGSTLDARWLEMRGQSIWLANQTASDRISVNGRANFFATEFVTLGLVGTVESKLINFRAEFANIVGTGNLTFVGDNSASAALVRATENIYDAASTRMEFLRFIAFTARSVHVADQVDDVFNVCGHVNFNVTDFVSVDAEGTAAIGTWRVTGGSGNIIHADSRTC